MVTCRAPAGQQLRLNAEMLEGSLLLNVLGAFGEIDREKKFFP